MSISKRVLPGKHRAANDTPHASVVAALIVFAASGYGHMLLWHCVRSSPRSGTAPSFSFTTFSRCRGRMSQNRRISVRSTLNLYSTTHTKTRLYVSRRIRVKRQKTGPKLNSNTSITHHTSSLYHAGECTSLSFDTIPTCPLDNVMLETSI